MDIKILVLFILNNCKPNMGVKKLNKLAFLLEFTYIFDHFNGNFSKNKQLTKTEFVALPMGPVIQDYKKLFQEMKTEKLIVQNTKADVGKIDYLPLVNIDSEIDENKKNEFWINTKISLRHNYKTILILWIVFYNPESQVPWAKLQTQFLLAAYFY